MSPASEILKSECRTGRCLLQTQPLNRRPKIANPKMHTGIPVDVIYAQDSAGVLY